MVLFSIPDIRLFWSDDERFTSQFKAGKIVKFNSYSKYPLCYKDVSFWLPETGLHPNDVYEVNTSNFYRTIAHVKMNTLFILFVVWITLILLQH